MDMVSTLEFTYLHIGCVMDSLRAPGKYQIADARLMEIATINIRFR